MISLGFALQHHYLRLAPTDPMLKFTVYVHGTLSKYLEGISSGFEEESMYMFTK